MIELLPLDKLRPDPLNVRRRGLGDIEAMADSLRKLGLIENLVVRPAGDGNFWVVCGQRRLAAAELAPLPELACDVREQMTDRDVIELSLTENVGREDMHPLDEADAYRRLVELGASQREIAELVGCSQSHVAKREQLLELPPVIQARIGEPADAGGITIGQALELHKLAEHPKHLLAAYKTWQSDSFYPLHRSVANELTEVEYAAKKAAAIKGLEASGTRIVEVDRFGTYNAPYKELGKAIGQVGLTVAKHRKLACHAAVVTRQGGVHHVCTKPASHPEYTPYNYGGGSSSAPLTEAQKAERSQARERNKLLKAAHAHRGGFIRTLVDNAGPADDVATLLTGQWLRSLTEHDSFGRQRAELIGALLDVKGVKEQYGPPRFRTPLAEYLAGGPANAGRLQLALVLAQGETAIRRDEWNASATAHYAFLETKGYKPAPVEKASLKDRLR